MLKTWLPLGFYVGGKRYFGLSVNRGFFGVNIDLLALTSPNPTGQKSPIMHLIINGYEFGQWLRILLWTGLPAMVLLTMLATWIQYRRSRLSAEMLVLQIEGVDEGDALSVEPEALPADERVDTERSVKEGEADYKENLYKGILWMKEKYEQYRELADERHGLLLERYERLKGQLAQMEVKYEELLTRVQQANPSLLEAPGTVSATPTVSDMALGAGSSSAAATVSELPAEEVMEERGQPEFSGGTGILVERAEAGGDRIRIHELEEQLARTQQRFDEEVGRQRYQLEEETARGHRLRDENNAGLEANRLLEQQVLHLSRQLEEKQRMIADLEGQLATDRQKIEELVAKLRNNSTLLMNIYQELDKSLHLSDGPPRE